MQIRKYPFRFSLVFFSLILCLIIFIVRLVFIQVFRSSYLAEKAKKQQEQLVEIEPRRGGIYDRQLRPLAMNISAYSLYANPRAMDWAGRQTVIKELCRVLSLNPLHLQELLDKDKYFVWIKRKLDSKMMNRIKSLDLVGIGFIKESRRYYPNDVLGMHLIGVAGMDNQGLLGLELEFDESLKGESGWSQFIRDAHQRQLMIQKQYIPPKDGLELVLTIDETIQYLTERALEKAYKKHNAKGASMIIMNPKTGEILAMANRPTFDGNQFSTSSTQQRRNRAVVDMYEPGSVFKIVTAAAALQEKAFDEDDAIFCENGQYRIANHILHDYRSHGKLTFLEVFQESSNIGVAKIAQKIGPEVVYQYARKFHFGEKTGIHLPGEVAGIVKTPSQWSKTTIGAFPIGQEVTVTALQLVCAISTIANGGILMKPYVVKYIRDQKEELIEEFHPQVVDQVISEDVAKRLTHILVQVVEKGTGRNARIKNVSVAGKTGTAQKVKNGIYSQKDFYASFIGFAPADDPKIAAVVVYDEPHPSHFGGTVAAPVFKEVIKDVLKYLEIK